MTGMNHPTTFSSLQQTTNQETDISSRNYHTFPYIHLSELENLLHYHYEPIKGSLARDHLANERTCSCGLFEKEFGWKSYFVRFNCTRGFLLHLCCCSLLQTYEAY
ncbi:uncharacterized protein Gasu_38970 [Galdieria sulphuraria]|uniref:Uncharacterized protein n=1 Tax=Galdieria sulphuraria TaxID=130081 RepID=M2XYT9_GALSU|nr:uncharacterized protein Gasu_38970 [Galdieria sulphuraria]EME28689.1 hypothetical protein Gasu_38970 [Galdieria sulphuraria]|eukprot:XP_005705209.1 hypothetical protein Gasu_38970 [Galdieria sulphuraria]